MRSSSVHALTALMFALVLATPESGAGQGLASFANPADSTLARRLDYRLLERALARYRALAADTSLAAIVQPSGRVVRPGEPLAMVSQLRSRLIAFGDLAATAPVDSEGVYTGPVVEGVRRFQQRHGLEGDGVIGRATLAALQSPPSLRVAQIEQSLEHMRLEPATNGGPYITVNVPSFRLFAFEGTDADSAPALDMKVIVGRSSRTPTPTLTGVLRSLEFWPYWNVPRSILVKEVLPKLRRDSTYLRREDMELVTADGDAVGDTVTADVMLALKAGQLRVRQRPGASNPLGTVKFVIPNDRDVFLHDTPGKELFTIARRDFSHGCVRLQGARDLAIWVTRGLPGWTADSVDAAMCGPLTRKVPVPRIIPVFLEYNVALATADGRVWFLPDVYRREPKPAIH